MSERFIDIPAVCGQEGGFARITPALARQIVRLARMGKCSVQKCDNTATNESRFTKVGGDYWMKRCDAHRGRWGSRPLGGIAE